MSEDAYDAFPYGTRPFPEAHPDRMFVVATAFGRDPVPPERARILELGCGEGGHLAPIAARFPEARCVGIDRSKVALAGARALSDRLGAPVTWLELDLTEAVEQLRRPDLPEAYDYIVAHGVYSWVPAPVREAMLDLASALLAPRGVAYFSYNCRPGWHLRGMVAEIMRHHVRGFSDPKKRVSQARAIVSFLAQTVPKHDPYGALLEREAKLVARQPDFWVFHDLLAEVNDPFLLTEFVADAARHHLAYLGDSDLASMVVADRMPPEVREVLEPLFEDVVQAEQYQDFLVCRNFRRSMLVRPEPPLAGGLSNEALLGLPIRGRLVLESASRESDLFKTRGDQPLETTHPLVRAMLRELTLLGGVSIPVDGLLDRVGARVPSGLTAEDRGLLRRNLMACWLRGGLDFQARAFGDPNGPGERPVADPLVRATAAGAEAVTSAFHEEYRLDGLDRDVLPLLDGTRTAAQVVDAVVGPDDPMREQVTAVMPVRFHKYWEGGLLVGT